MRITVRKILLYIMIGLFSSGILFSGCSKSNNVYMVSIQKSTEEGDDGVYIVTYSDGSTQELIIKDGVDGKDGIDGINGINGKDGVDGKDGIDGKDGVNGTNGIDGVNGTNGTNGIDGLDGEDGEDLQILDIYEEYKKQNPNEDITFNEFLEKYFLLNYTDNSMTINKCLLSCMKVYSEFAVNSGYTVVNGELIPSKSLSVSTGSAVIYKIENEYTYIVSNYHVVYDANVNEDNGGYIARRIVGYIYGSEGSPFDTETEVDGYPVYDYGSYAIELEYIGGTATYDIAVLKAKTQDILKINENAKAVTLAENNYVGQTAIAIGNPEDEGISVTQGIISVVNEDILLSVGSVSRYYRSLRIDTALYSGNSGGGLFNNQGQLIGITNAGNVQNQNVNYAIPLDIVKGCVENILYYASDSDDNTVGAYKIVLGFSVTESNLKYVYDEKLGYGEILGEVNVYQVVEDSIIESLGLLKGDIVKTFYVNDTAFDITRNFNISDTIFEIRPNDTIKFSYLRDGVLYTTQDYVVTYDKLTNIE